MGSCFWAVGTYHPCLQKKKKSNLLSVVSPPFVPPCLALSTRKQMVLAVTGGCYFNSEIMVTLCRMRGQE